MVFLHRASAIGPVYDPVFANNTWEQIIDACHRNAVPDTWVADGTCYKDMEINGTNYRIDIIGKNHDTYTAGGTAPLTFQMHDCYDETKQMNPKGGNAGGWEECEMRNTILPDILLLMPAAVQAGIQKVNKKSGTGGGSSSGTQTTSDDLFLLSEIEIFGERTHSVAGEGTQYEYYSVGNSTVKKVGGSASRWWERSPTSSNTRDFCCVTNVGGADYNDSSVSHVAAFGFCF